jgi:uncharacterized protein YodC (DUF2158 family)
MAKREKVKTPVARSKFKVGDKVRVKHGVRDTDYPDIPMGGWAGTITEVHKDGMYTIRWSRETLASIHPVVKKRSERDGTVLEEYWLGDDDVEADPGGPLEMEQPSEITAMQLSPKDEDDRIRMVFGLTSNDLLPEVDDETLETYQQFLAENLAFPVEAEYRPEYGRSEKCEVIGLGDPGEEPPYIDDQYGLLCDARIGRRKVVLPVGELKVTKGKPNRQLIEDYCTWFWNNR